MKEKEFCDYFHALINQREKTFGWNQDGLDEIRHGKLESKT